MIATLVLTRFATRPSLGEEGMFGVPLDKVFDPARLALRLETLAMVTAPSLRAQTVQDFKWLIITDPMLPAETRTKLEAVVADMPQAVIVRIDEILTDQETIHERGWLEAFIDPAASHVLSANVDNDDGLGQHVLERLRRQAEADIRNPEVSAIRLYGQGDATQWDMFGIDKAPFGAVKPWSRRDPWGRPFFMSPGYACLAPREAKLQVLGVPHNVAHAAEETRDYLKWGRWRGRPARRAKPQENWFALHKLLRNRLAENDALFPDRPSGQWVHLMPGGGESLLMLNHETNAVASRKEEKFNARRHVTGPEAFSEVVVDWARINRYFEAKSMPEYKLCLEPYAQRKGAGWYNPLTGSWLGAEDSLHDAVECWSNGRNPNSEELNRLRMAKWAVPDVGTKAGDRYVLRYVNLEATSRCNQRCHFCPVSISQRPDVQMSSERFAGVVGDLALMKKDIQGVFLFGYNEPSLDRRLTERVELLHQHGLPVALNTNGSGFVPKLTDALRALGGIRLLSVNLSTLDPERYKETRGHDHLAKVLKNLDYLAAHPVAEQMTIAVLDEDVNRLAESEKAIVERFADTPFQVTGYPTMNRAGLVPEAGQTFDHEKLAGCDCIGSRAVEHIQIDAEGNLILCCQDYHSEEKIGTWQQPGDLQRLLSSERARTLRNWVHGIEEAPAEFICRKCEFAIPAAT